VKRLNRQLNQIKNHEADHPNQIADRAPGLKALGAHHQKLQKLHLRKLFADDPTRGERLTAEAAGLYLDYSKNRITDRTIKLLVQLAEESDLSGG